MSRATVLCFGDSNTWGYDPERGGARFPVEVRWPGRLARALSEEATVVEEGLNSRTTVHDDPMQPGRNGLAYLVPCLDTHAPVEVVVLMLGTNDLKARFAAGSHDIALGNARLLDAIATSAAGPDGGAPRMLLVAPPPLGRLSEFAEMFAGGEATSRRIAPRVEALARERGCAFLNAGDYVSTSDLDGIHLDAVGHAALAEAVGEGVRTLLSR